MNKNNKIENIVSVEENNNILLFNEEAECMIIPFSETSEIYSSKGDYEAFIKSVERIVRKSRTYKEYIYELKNKYGLDRCSILGKITSEMVKIEMHHGPIFTLYDYAEILMSYLLDVNNDIINEFDLAELIMQEHCQHNIQVVMLSEAVHKSIHAKNKSGNSINSLYIPFESVWGNFFNFIDKYKNYLQLKHINKINDYISLGKENDDKLFIVNI